jgi:hypothetical protein
MFTPILLALLISASSAGEASASAAPTEPLKMSLGDMSFSGDTIKLTKSGDGTFECEIDGRAELTFGTDGDTDMAIAAQKLVISGNASDKLSIRCTGDCKLTDSEYTCTADRMQFQFVNEIELTLAGNSRVEFGTGDNRSVLAGESITCQGGTFRVSGAALLKRTK